MNLDAGSVYLRRSCGLFEISNAWRYPNDHLP